MKSILFLLVVAFLASTCEAEVGRRCTDDSECGGDECCQIINIIVASKKRQFLDRPNTSGTCQKFSQRGDYCNSFDVMNGYCGCEQGLTCTMVPLTTSPAISTFLSRSRRRPAGPSYCLN